MSIPFSLLAKTLGGVAAVAAPVATGVIYRENIYNFLNPEQKTIEKLLKILNDIGITQKIENIDQELKLTSTDLRKLKLFEGEENNTVSGISEDKHVTLKIEESSDDFFSEGFKFTLTSTSTVTINKNNDTTNSISLTENKGIEFRLTEKENNKYLEEVWDIEKVKETLKLDCNTDKTCTIKSGEKINVKDGDTKIQDASFKEGQTNKKIKFEEKQKNYEKGFRFFVEEEILLSGNGGSEDSNKLTVGSNYQMIKEDSKWYLSKK